ncbi:hypothetical protein ACVR1G_07090 [Streptococcus dentasini]
MIQLQLVTRRSTPQPQKVLLKGKISATAIAAQEQPSSIQESSSSVQSEPAQEDPKILDEEQPNQEQDRIVYVARDGTADVYWYSMDNMPADTNQSRVVQMKESDAIAAGKRHTMKEY